MAALLCWSKSFSGLMFVLFYIVATSNVGCSPIQDVDGDARPASIEVLQMSRSTTQIEVSWALSSSLCSPDYYIIRYSLLQKLACQSPETTPTEFEVITNFTQYNTLVGLEPYSRYKITVTAVNGTGQSEPTIGYSETRPGAPSNITNVRVNPERTFPTRLGFTWQPLNCRNVNGEFSYYFPRIYKNGDRTKSPAGSTYLDDDFSYSSVEFNGLEACTMYELNIHAVNRDVSTPGNVSYAIGVTGVNFTSASAYATGNQPRLTVYWRVPSQCTVDYYKVSYQLVSRKACQDVPVIDAPVYELNVTSSFTYVSEYLSDLEYYATYNISIIAVISGAESLPMNVSGDTRYGGPASVRALRMSPSTTQIEVSWETSSSLCSADYYIIRYSLSQKLACSSLETNSTEFEVNTTVKQYNIVGLEPHSRYQITVTSVNGAGQSEPTIGFSDTRPGPPSNITNVRVNPEMTSPTRLGFTWQPLNCRNVNGVFYYYYPRIYKDGDRNYPPVQRTYLDNNISYSSVEFNGLEPCTMYELHFHAVNRNVPTPGNVSYAIGVTGVTFTSASAYATGNQPSLTVHWSVPSQCNVDYYRVSYQLISRKACQDVPVIDAPVFELNVTSVSTDVSRNLSNLEYYATYNISIIAVIRKTESLAVNISGDTRDGDPTGPPTNIQSTSTKKRSIVFTWERPECGNRNGPITSYEVRLSNSTGDVVYHGNVSASTRPELEISDLIPYSIYSIRIRAWNYELEGEYGPAISAQTNEDKPAPPIGVKLPSSDLESITVEWMSPNPPLGRIIGYYIVYWETDEVGATPKNFGIPCRDGLCSDINYRFSTFIPDLQRDTNYSVQVMAETVVGFGSSSPDPPVVRITSEGIPSDPQEVAVTRRSKSLLITWKEPRYPRGKIISYTLAYKVKGKPHDRSFQPGDSFTMKEVAGDISSFVLDDLEPATLYEVYVVASTSKGEGESSQHVEGFTEPPEAEELPKPNPPVIVSSPDGSPTIQFSDVLESPYITHILVAVEERLPVARRRHQQAAYGSYAENPSSYIAASISKDDLPIELTIGDNETYGNYHNAPLKDKAIYDVRTGVECNVGGQKSTLFGDPSEVQPAGVPSGSIATVVGSSVGAILVIVIVIILIIIIFYKRRSDKSAPTKSKGKESDSSQQYENPVFDQSKTDVHTYQDLNTNAKSYENLTDPHIYEDFKKPDQETNYEELTDVINRDYVNVPGN